MNLVDTLNGGEFTVFAPTDDAFAKIDPATIEKLKTDSDLLTSILTYHVVPGQAEPGAGRRHAQDGPRRRGHVSGAGDDLKVNDAGLVCGGVKTANATVYMIDTVLMPPAANSLTQDPQHASASGASCVSKVVAVRTALRDFRRRPIASDRVNQQGKRKDDSDRHRRSLK